jgi:hypothetical protein
MTDVNDCSNELAIMNLIDDAVIVDADAAGIAPFSF